MHAENVEYADLIVAGGGPAGSTLAALVAMQGHKVVVLEKERFPPAPDRRVSAAVHGAWGMPPDWRFSRA